VYKLKYVVANFMPYCFVWVLLLRDCALFAAMEGNGKGYSSTLLPRLKAPLAGMCVVPHTANNGFSVIQVRLSHFIQLSVSLQDIQVDPMFSALKGHNINIRYNLHTCTLA